MSDSEEWEDEQQSDDEQPIVRQRSFTLITAADIEGRLQKEIGNFSELFGVTPEEALVLLTSYQWNSHRLQEEWLTNELSVRIKCGLSLPQAPQTVASSRGVKLGAVKLVYGSQGDCDICYTHMSEKDALQCGHSFCCGCWREYLFQRVNEGPQCIGLKCPRFMCSLAVPENMFRKFLQPEMWRLYTRYKCEHFVLFEKSYRWCPSPGCIYISEFPNLGAHEIKCNCGFVYCFACGEEAHRPALCKLMREWSVKNSAESENVTWILANTKQCPKCRKPIEKNQGCNHMTCNKAVAGCGHEFCWLCLGPWAEHNSSTGGYYKCNKYETEMQKDGSQVKKEESKRNQAKTELDKYMFYFERYNNHLKAQKLAKQQLPEVEQKMQLLHDVKRYPIGELEFLKEGAEQVIECRRILKCTYAFGYFLEPGNEKNLFEHLQQQLEENTEHLHELAEKKLDEFLDPENLDRSPFYHYKSNLTNYTQVTKRFLANLLDGIDNGLTAFI